MGDERVYDPEDIPHRIDETKKLREILATHGLTHQEAVTLFLDNILRNQHAIMQWIMEEMANRKQEEHERQRSMYAKKVG